MHSNDWLEQVKYILVLGLSVSLSHAQWFKTKDSVVFKVAVERRPRLPGPSIFEYQNPGLVPLTSPPEEGKTEIQRGSDGNGKFKRNHNETGVDAAASSSSLIEALSPAPLQQTRYFEMAGDEMYVFEPSPLGAQPFMDALFPERDASRRPPKRRPQHRPRHKPNNLEVSHSSPAYSHFHNVHPPHFFPFRYVPVSQQHTSSEPVIVGEDGYPTEHYQDEYYGSEQVSSSPTDSEWGQSDDSAEWNVDNTPSEGECVSANEKEGQCVSFKVCYPVVFNMVTGELRNHGLARMLYQASGPCDKNETWTVQTVSVQVQPGLLSNVPLEIPPDYFNHTVCCPGYFYFENTIPHHYDSKKPSHSDTESSPQDDEKQMLPMPPFHLPPPYLLHQHDMYDSNRDEDEHNDVELEPNYMDELNNLESLVPFSPISTTASPVLRPSTAKPRRRVKIAVTKYASIGTKDSLADTSAHVSKNVTKISKESENGKSVTVTKATTDSKQSVKISLSPSNRTIATKATIKRRPDGDKGKGAKGTAISKPKATFSPSPEHSHKNQSKIVTTKTAPVVVPPPHLSAWNCPGRQVGSLRGHWPWLVALLNEGSHFCSGSLVDRRHVLTTASCVASFQGKDIGKMRVILGDRVLYSSVDGPHVWRKIVRITRHLDYDADSMDHDIAILEMDSPVTYTPNIQPINLPSSSNKAHTNKAIVSGWSGSDLGKRFFAARPTIDSVVEFMERDECYRKYDGFTTDKVPDAIICTKPSQNGATCNADLGAPLMMKTGNCWHVIGIFSHGLGCGMFPDIFTDTARHLPWIQKNIRPHFSPEDTFLKT